MEVSTKVTTVHPEFITGIQPTEHITPHAMDSVQVGGSSPQVSQWVCFRLYD